jgi:hypothetical protein
VALLVDHLELTPDIAVATYLRAVDPADGLTPDARLDLDGLRTVLALRTELEGDPGARPLAADRYYDPQYYRRALAALGP